MQYIYLAIIVLVAALILFIIMDHILKRFKKPMTAERGIWNAVYFIQLKQYEQALQLLRETEAEFALLPEEMCDLCVQRADAYKGLEQMAEAADAYDGLFDALLQCAGRRKRNDGLLAEMKACYEACGRAADYEKWQRLFEEPILRRAEGADLDGVEAIYEAIHTEEEAGRATTGWIRGVYPTRATAEAALEAGTLFVAEAEGQIVAAARIDQEQVPVYAEAGWATDAPAEQVLVLHTLVVDPARAGKGCASKFVAFYEQYAKALGCPYLRMDTNEKNTAARALYQKLGYREVGTVPCNFNGIEGVPLVCLEKTLL